MPEKLQGKNYHFKTRGQFFRTITISMSEPYLKKITTSISYYAPMTFMNLHETNKRFIKNLQNGSQKRDAGVRRTPPQVSEC